MYYYEKRYFVRNDGIPQIELILHDDSEEGN